MKSICCNIRFATPLNSLATRVSISVNSEAKALVRSRTWTRRCSSFNSALNVPGSRLTVLVMNTRSRPDGNRRLCSTNPGEIGSRGCSARLATSTPPYRERQRKNGTKLTIPVKDQEKRGSSTTLTNVVNSTTGAPTSHESIALSVSIHHIKAN